MAAIVAAGFVPPAWPDGVEGPLDVVGGAIALLGAVVVVASARALGSAFTPFPKPRGELVTAGLYRYARHPIYGGGILFFAGWGLFRSPAALLMTLALAVFWDRKARFEERLLAERYPDYADYRRRTRRRLLPFVY